MEEEHERLLHWKENVDAERKKIVDLDLHPDHWRVKAFQNDMRAFAAAWEGLALKRKAATGSSDKNEVIEELQEALARVETRLDESAQTSRTHATVGKEMQGSTPMVGLHTWNAFEVLNPGDPRVHAAVAAVSRQWHDVHPTGRSFQMLKDLAKHRKRALEASFAQASVANVDTRASANTSPAQSVGQPASMPGTTDLSLSDICRAEAILPERSFSEESDMQPKVFELLQVISTAVGSDATLLVDTHSSGLHNPVALPDAVRFVEAGLRVWSQVDHHYEFKLSSSPPDTETAVGQLVERTQHCMAIQHRRTTMLGVAITMDSVKLLHFKASHRSRNLAHASSNQAGDGSGSGCANSSPVAPGKLELTHTDHLPLRMSATSSGFRALCSVLAQSAVALGYVPDYTPVFNFPKFKVEKAVLIARGTAQSGGNFVYQVEVVSRGDEDGQCTRAVAKLCESTREAEHVRAMAGSPFVVQLMDECTCSAWGADLHVMLLGPFVNRITADMSLEDVTQVLCDVAAGVDAMFERDKRHCDIGLNNIGWHEKDGKIRGLVFDMSAAKDINPASGSPPKQLNEITGTFSFMALSVLKGGQHDLSSHLESIFISVVAACYGGRLPGEPKGQQLDSWVHHRLATFAGDPFTRGPQHLLPLVNRLHELFWPNKTEGDAAGRLYRTGVTTAEFTCACNGTS